MTKVDPRLSAVESETEPQLSIAGGIGTRSQATASATPGDRIQSVAKGSAVTSGALVPTEKSHHPGSEVSILQTQDSDWAPNSFESGVSIHRDEEESADSSFHRDGAPSQEGSYFGENGDGVQSTLNALVPPPMGANCVMRMRWTCPMPHRARSRGWPIQLHYSALDRDTSHSVIARR